MIPVLLKGLLTKTEFTKNTAVLFGGTVLAQAIPLLLQPLLRRYYSVDDFGAMAIYLNLFGVITIVSGLRYEPTIVLPRNDSTAANLLSLTLLINMGFALVTFLIVILFKSQIVSWIEIPEKYSFCLYLLPFSSFFFSAFQGINYWLIRKKAFKASSINKITRRGVEGSVQTSAGFLNFGSGLFWGDFFGNLANVISGYFQLFKNGFNTEQVSRKRLAYSLKKYIHYPKFNLLPTLFSSFAAVLPYLFINKFYSTASVAFVDLSRLVLSIPLIFISATMSQVLFQMFTEKKHLGLTLKKEIKGIGILLLSIVIVEFLLIHFFAEDLFQFVFGDQYYISGVYSRILVFSFGFNFIVSTFSSIFITFDKIVLNAVWQCAYFITICSLYFCKELPLEDFLKVFVTIEIVMYAVYGMLMFKIVQAHEQAVTKSSLTK